MVVVCTYYLIFWLYNFVCILSSPFFHLQDPGPVPDKMIPPQNNASAGSTGDLGFNLPEIPGDSWTLPDDSPGDKPPSGGGAGTPSAPPNPGDASQPPKDDVDFDDLARRFEELKKRG